jgi:hypothetical protein
MVGLVCALQVYVRKADRLIRSLPLLLSLICLKSTWQSMVGTVRTATALRKIDRLIRSLPLFFSR